MSTLTKPSPIPKVMALILVSIGAAFLMLGLDASALAKLDSMSATDYVQHQRQIHHHSIVLHFISVLIMGGFYIGAVEFITYVIGLFFKKSDA